MGKIAIVTGGSRGIGAATALLAAKAGYDVCINYVSDHKAADQIVAECQGLDVRAIAVQADIADADQVGTCSRPATPNSARYRCWSTMPG